MFHAEDVAAAGQTAFNRYREFRGGKNHDGTPTPTWEELSPGIRAAWEEAVVTGATTLYAASTQRYLREQAEAVAR